MVFETTAVGRAWLPQHAIRREVFVKSLMKWFFIWVSISLYIEVQLPRSSKTERIAVETGISVESIMKQFDIKPDTCLTLINNKPVPIDEIIKEGQTLTLVEVTSGG